MANVIEFSIKGSDKFSGPMGKLTKNLGAARKGTENFTKKLRSMQSRVFTARNAIGLLAGTTGLGLLAKTFIDAASTSEQLRVRLSILLGSVEEGNRLFKEMSEFAAKVPFEFEEIMNSATVLAGVMKGGVDEIKQWIPLIGDLAATAGLGIQETTEQVQKMLSGGSGAADRFRERGILAMLGFTAGVSLSAEETKKKLAEAWTDTNSMFRGATQKLANTWVGTMSMISDKWFQFRNLVMDAGLFDFIKAFVAVIDKRLGKALTDNGEIAKGWAGNVITAFQSAGKGVGFLLDGIHAIRLGFMALDLAAAAIAAAIWVMARTSVNAIAFLVDVWISSINNLIKVANGIPGITIAALEKVTDSDLVARIGDITEGAVARISTLKDALDDMALGELPSANITRFFEEVQAEAERTKEVIQQTAAEINLLGGGTSEADAEKLQKMQEEAEKRFELVREQLLTERELEMEHFAMQQEALAEALALKLISEEEFRDNDERSEIKHMKALEKIRKAGLTKIAKFQEMNYQMQTKTAIGELTKLTSGVASNNKTLFKLNKASGIANAIINTFVGVSHSLGAYPMPIAAVMAALHLAVGLATVASIKSASFSGGAQAGLESVPTTGTFLLHQGERVISQRQNLDLTNFLGSSPSGGGGGGTTIIENIEIHVMENATSGDALLEMDSNEIREVVAAKIIPAFNELDAAGIRPNASERQRDT